MKDFDIGTFMKERHKAFADVLHKRDFNALREYCEKYGAPMPENEWIVEVAALKGICNCTDFSAKDRKKAEVRLKALGSSPSIVRGWHQ